MKLEVGDEFKVDDVYDSVVEKTELYVINEIIKKDNKVKVFNKTKKQNETFLLEKDEKFRKSLVSLFKKSKDITSGYKFELLKNI